MNVNKEMKICTELSLWTKSNRRDWAGLPRHLLFEIMDRLAVVDHYVRFGAVCTSWQAIFLEENISNLKKHCSQPFLLIDSPHEDHNTMVLYSLNKAGKEEGKLYNFDLQLAAHTNYCRGSTFGWLITASECKDNDNNLHVHLRNPFLSGIINLPDIVKVHLDRNRFEIDNPLYLWKAALSCDPCLSEEFQVAAIVSPVHGLAVLDFRRGNWVNIGDDWGVIDEKLTNFEDVIFFTKTRQFYVIRFSQYLGYNNGEVLAIDFDGGGCPKLVPVVPPLTDENCCRNDDYPTNSYLVEDVPLGELLLVLKWIDCESERTDFEVFKLDPTNETWTPNDMSGKVLFLGISTSVIRFASDCPGCKPNSVYFTEDYVPMPQWRAYGLPADGVYDLETRSLHQHYSTPTPSPRSKKFTPPPIWVEPTLQRYCSRSG